nr:MAG TPA: hypothetical protein [Caudoviricetes sp.]
MKYVGDDGGGGLTESANSPYLVPQIPSKIKRPFKEIRNGKSV